MPTVSPADDFPTPEEIRAARKAAGLTQTEAAQLAGLSTFSRWSECERGVKRMSPERFELYRIKAGLHPDFGPRSRRSKKSLSLEKDDTRDV